MVNELVYPRFPPGGNSVKRPAGQCLFLVSGPAPIQGQLIMFDGDPSNAWELFWVGNPFNSPDQYGGQAWPIVMRHEAWWDYRVQSTPPGIVDKRSAAQKESDEAARLRALAANPLGGVYSRRYAQLASSGSYYPAFATYVRSAVGLIEV
jgi:hypothetical protein